MSYEFELQVTSELIDCLYKGREDIDKLNLEVEPDENQSFLFRSASEPKKSALVVYKSPYFQVAKNIDKTLQGIKGKDARQKLFLSSLQDEKVLMSVALGKAGTGKTLLSVAYALHQYFKADKDIVLIKPSNFVGGKSAVMGPVPGDSNEKLAGTMASYMVHFKALLGKDADHFLFEMLENKRLHLLPIEQARGMSLENSTVIFDECQNTDFHTMKTIVSRVASSSKLICLGDLGQVDIPNLHYKESGLYIFLNSPSFKDSPVTSVITLLGQYRSELANLCEMIHDEIRENED